MRGIIFILFALAAFLFLFRLGAFPFLDYDEATFALVFSEGWQSGDFLSLTSHGQLWIDKPPLLFWLMAASVKLFGENEFALRLPVALLGLAAVFGTYLVTWQVTKNQWKAIFASSVLFSVGDFIFAARQIRMDVPVAAAIIFALYFFIRGWENQRWYLGFGAAIAAGVLFKSVIGFFIFPITLIFSAVYGKWDWLKNKYFWLSIILAVGLIIPWYFYETIKFGSGFFRQLLAHNIGSRFVRSNASLWYYPKLLFQFTQPWITVFLIAAALVLRKLKFWFQEDKLAIASFFSVLFIFAVFETVSTKLFYYLEPIYPFMAIFIGSISAGFSKKRVFGVVFALLFLIGIANVFWQIFEIKGGQTGEYALAKEEKQIGLYLGNQQFSGKVYTSNFYNYETIYYYGRNSNIKLAPFQGDLKEASFFLVIPTAILQTYDLAPDLQERADLVYAGKILTMFNVK